MNENPVNFSLEQPAPPAAKDAEPMTQGMSSLYKLFEAFIALREKNERQHRLFEQSLTKTRDTMIERFSKYVGETQQEYQNLRRELTGEKRIALTILSELLEIGLELEHIAAARPELIGAGEHVDGLLRWADAIEVQSRKVQATLERHGIFPYDAVIGAPYVPALHERVGSKRVEGMDALRVAEQREHGYASQHHDFVLRRPKVIVTE